MSTPREHHRMPAPDAKPMESWERSCSTCGHWDHQPLPFREWIWALDEKGYEDPNKPIFEGKCHGWYPPYIYGSFGDETCDRWKPEEKP